MAVVSISKSGKSSAVWQPPFELAVQRMSKEQPGVTMDLQLKHKRVIVTGTHKGISRAISSCSLNEGARLVICARDKERLTQAASELSALGEVHGQSCDLSYPDKTCAFVD